MSTWYDHLRPVVGLSAEAIAGSGSHHPHDPADLVRCVAQCDRLGIDTEDLRRRVARKSPQWARLVDEWDNLVALLRHEVETSADGTAPRTYAAMRRVINDGLPCPDCDSTGRGAECPKCKGTGRRSGGRCRAERCFRGADYCPTCKGNSYLPKPKDGAA